MNFTYKYFRPALTVDVIILKLGDPIQVLLIERKNPPFKKKWALPGGFVDKNEALENAAIRELSEETSLKNIALKQLQTFGDPGRDPRGHTVSVVFWGIMKNKNFVKAGDDAAKAEWFNLNDLPSLAFDHEAILNYAKNNIAEIRHY